MEEPHLRITASDLPLHHTWGYAAHMVCKNRSSDCCLQMYLKWFTMSPGPGEPPRLSCPSWLKAETDEPKHLGLDSAKGWVLLWPIIIPLPLT